MDKYLMAPFAPAFVLDADAAASSSEAAPETGVATQAATDTAANQAATEAAAGEESKGDWSLIFNPHWTWRNNLFMWGCNPQKD